MSAFDFSSWGWSTVESALVSVMSAFDFSSSGWSTVESALVSVMSAFDFSSWGWSTVEGALVSRRAPVCSLYTRTANIAAFKCTSSMAFSTINASAPASMIFTICSWNWMTCISKPTMDSMHWPFTMLRTPSQ